MKKLLLILLCLPMIGFGQNSLFTHDLSNSVVATTDPSRTMGLEVNTIVYNNILSESPESFHLDFPFFNQNISLYLERFEVHSTDLKVMAKTLDGTSELNVIPTILSYKIMLNDNSIGVMNFFNGQINATFKVNNQQFEIVDYSNNYILFEASNSINSSNFSCGVESQFNSISTPQNSGASSTQVCIELALEIDYFTRQTFNSNAEAVNWALAILAGVDQLYQAQTNASGSIVGIYIWQVTDPFAAYVNDASNMLVALKDHWNANMTSVNRDLVHLLTKRTNTGTGGIAWLDALCDNNWGYGFSEVNNDTTYSFPNPAYTWNLAVVTHEIGHNIGAHHTFWCGWAADPSILFFGGAITNCVDVDGSCPNNPSPGVGTIMSYCHTVSGGSMILEFHDVVLSQAINPGIANASCLTACLVYGCTDQTACNYDPLAIIDDGSCIGLLGCMDATACNYDANATCDDGSCLTAYGCTDPTACNYNSLATCDDGSCHWLYGCTYPSAYNYDPAAICDDGSCIAVVLGCIDSTAFNYDPLANTDDGSCCLVAGCMDINALNYNANAVCDDGSCAYPQTYIPDDNFEAYLEANGMGNGVANDDSVRTSSIDTVTSLTVYTQYIADLTGIEAFTALTYLYCGWNQLTSLDLSNNTNLTYLEMPFSGSLTSLDISNCINLTHLLIYSIDISPSTGYGSLTTLDVSNNINLTHLSCSGHQLTSLDVSQNTNLTHLYCNVNQLTSLDVSNNTALGMLSCGFNQLTSLDVSQNTVLYSLSINCFDYLNPTSTGYGLIANLNLSNNPNLTGLNCSGNQLSILDVRNGNNTNMNLYAINNPNLFCIDVDDPVYSTANWTDIDAASSFSANCDPNGCTDPLACNYDQLATIDDGSCTYATTSTDIQVHCDSYTWLNGVTYTASNNSAIWTTTTAGCVNVATLNLTINNSSISTDIQVHCDSYTWLDGNTYTTSGTYTDVSTNASGCDHTETLYLTINNSTSNSTSSTDTHVACDEFMWNCDGNTYTSSNNTATYVYTNAAGCDSTVTLDLTINSSTSSTDTHVACDEFMWNCDGNTYTSSNNTATYTYTNAAGCDSTVTLDLTINNSTSSIDAHIACDSYIWSVDGNTYTTSGTYTNVSTNVDGCDHTETLELTINSVIASIDQEGDSLYAVTTPVGLNANWYNIQIEDSTSRIWLMEEGTSSFTPTFECSYFIVVEDMGCTDTSETYYYGANAARIGSIITSPNPTSGLINVKFDNSKNQFVMLELISNNGSKLDEFITVNNNLNIDLSKYPSGIYYLYFNSEDATQGCRLEDVQRISTKIILNK